jgi:hypothetical protein
MKYKDPKTILEPGEKFANALNIIDLMMMIPMSPYLACQLSWFMTMNLYGGAWRSIETKRDVRVFRQVRTFWRIITIHLVF